MNPKEQNIIGTLNLLVLLFRSKKQSIPKPTEEQQHMLVVTKEHLAKAQITIPVFINTLNTLSEKGYLFGVSTFEDKSYAEIQKALSDENYSKIVKQLEAQDTAPFMLEFKERIGDLVEKTKPANTELDRKGLMDENVSLISLIDDARSLLANHTSNDVAIVTLMPFRSIERLLEKMNDGMKFDEVQDVGIWYNPSKYEFHFGDEIASTAYRGSPTKAHYVLNALFNNSKDSVVDYSDIPEFNNTHGYTKENKAFSDAMRLFISKHSELDEIFKVYSDRLELQEKYTDDTH